MPFNLCGMGVDLLRSCYSTTMQFFDPPRDPIPVTWFFCADGAKVLPFWTRFASGNWASERYPWIGPGEVESGPRKWSNGEPPGPNPATFLGGQPLFGDAAQTDHYTWVFPTSFPQGATCLIAVVIKATAGPPGIQSVTDTGGHAYVKDLAAICPGDNTLSIEVWRTSNPGDFNAGNLLTFHFVGSTLLASYSLLYVGGLLAGPPITSKVTAGGASDNPQVAAYPTAHFDQLELLVLNAGHISAQPAAPPTFTSWGEVWGATPYANGVVAFAAKEHRERKARKWGGTVTTPWVSAGLVYQAEKKPVPPGQKFCGPEELARGGAPPDAPKGCTTASGYCACCFDWKLPTCCDWRLATLDYNNLTVRIVAIRNPGPLTPAYVGMKIVCSRFGPIGSDYQGFIPPYPPDVVPNFFEVGCSSDIIVVGNAYSDERVGVFTFRPKPLGIFAANVGPYALSPDERWDVVVEANPSQAAPPPQPPVYLTFPNGWWPAGWFPPMMF